MSKVYGLKRATQRMKYVHMKNVMEWERDLSEAQDREHENRMQLKERYADALEDLRTVDPDGWSAWYDKNVPDWDGWQNCKPALDAIISRVTELAHDKAAFVELVDLANSDPAHIQYADPFEGESTPFVWGGEVYYPQNSHRNSGETSEDMPF